MRTETAAPTGELRIRAERIGSRTALVNLYRTVPFHTGLPNPRSASDTAELIIQEVGPGYLPADRLAIDLAVGSGASLTVRAQGATRIYRSPGGIPAIASCHLTVADGGRLVYLPGEIIPFSQSIFEQDTTIEVQGSGLVIASEIVTPGRAEMGEAHEFTLLNLNVIARLHGRPCLIERAKLEPGSRPLSGLVRHGASAIAGTLYMIGQRIPLPHDPVVADEITWGIAEGDGYALIRFLGPTTQAVTNAIRQFLPG